MTPEEYFDFQQPVLKKRYDALHAFFVDKLSASEVAESHGYSLKTFYSIIRDFRKYLKEGHKEDFFFKNVALGRKPSKNDDLDEMIVSLRKKNFSVEDIVSIANSKSFKVTYGYVYKMLQQKGFARLPRRSAVFKKQLEFPTMKAPIAEKLEMKLEKFQSSNTGLLAFLPIIYQYGIHRIIESSSYPSTRTISKLSSILSFLALKLSNVKRYSHDDFWCMDRGMGLFAGLNVLPKTAWFSSYSSRVDSEMNLSFLKALHQEWCRLGILSDTVNLDFTTVGCGINMMLIQKYLLSLHLNFNFFIYESRDNKK